MVGSIDEAMERADARDVTAVSEAAEAGTDAAEQALVGRPTS
jgi:hypothetical protein